MTSSLITPCPAIGFHCGAGDGPKGTKLGPFLTILRTRLPLTAAQIFISSPTSFAHCSWLPSTCKAINTYVTTHKIRLFVHAPYIMNPCTDDITVIHGLLVNLLHTAATMGAEGVVIHVGKSLKLGEPEGLRRMRVFVDGVLVATAATGTPAARLLIETCAGQGTEVARDLKVFGAFVKEVVATHGAERVGACVDTCHVFACGYRIRSLAETVGSVIGWENVHLIHLNDSKTECGKRVDRHECIGHGKIGKAELGAFCSDVASAAHHAAFIFETPDVDDDGVTRTAEFAWFHSLFASTATDSL